nr:hypothetical protein [Nostoc sp. ChiSLP03a]
MIIQVKLYEDKRLQGFDYQGLPLKRISFVKHCLPSDLQKQKAISNNYSKELGTGDWGLGEKSCCV